MIQVFNGCLVLVSVSQYLQVGQTIKNFIIILFTDTIKGIVSRYKRALTMIVTKFKYAVYGHCGLM